MGDLTFTCPQCGRTSWHPKDVEYRYCGNCHEFFPELWVVLGGDVVYAERPTREEAEAVLEANRHLVRRFGVPRIEQRVVSIGSRRLESRSDQ